MIDPNLLGVQFLGIALGAGAEIGVAMDSTP
jgi:hypothetical protein